MQRAKERATNRRVRRETGELKGIANHASISVSLFVLKINKEAAKDRSLKKHPNKRRRKERENPKERKEMTKKKEEDEHNEGNRANLFLSPSREWL